MQTDILEMVILQVYLKGEAINLSKKSTHCSIWSLAKLSPLHYMHQPRDTCHFLGCQMHCKWSLVALTWKFYYSLLDQLPWHFETCYVHLSADVWCPRHKHMGLYCFSTRYRVSICTISCQSHLRNYSILLFLAPAFWVLSLFRW